MWNPVQITKIPPVRQSGKFGFLFVVLSIFSVGLFGSHPVLAEETTILNVSRDVAREFYQEYNREFAAYWKNAKAVTSINFTKPEDKI